MGLPQKNPYDQYKRTEINTANQGKLIENMNPKTYDIVNTNIIKAQDIVTELLLSLNMKEGGEISKNLMSLYVYFKRRLLEANLRKDPEIIKEVMKMMKDL